MRLHSRKTIINYVPEGNPPKAERTRINIALYLYITALILLFLYIFYIIYTKLRYVEFTGFIQVPKVVVKTHKDGVVDKIFVKNGLAVKKGEPLFSIKYSVETTLPISVRLNLRTRLDDLKVKLNAVEDTLKHINTPDILKLKSQINSIKAQIVSKESLLKAMQRMIWKNKELNRTSRLLELSPVNPGSLESIKLNIERLKATIASLKSTLKSLEDEKRSLEEIERRSLLFKERSLKRNITLLERELKQIGGTVFKTEVENVVKSQLNGKVLEVNVVPHQSVAKGDSLAVIIPDKVKVKFLLVAGQKKLKYLKKGLKLSLVLHDGRELSGKIVDIYSSASGYQPKLTKDYWPLFSPIVGEVEIRKPPDDLYVLDGVKVKAFVGRKIWNIF